MRVQPTLMVSASLLMTPLMVAAVPVVSMGAHGSRVAQIQQQLQDLGYRPGPVNGNYGARTRMAVAAFQQAHHISGHGGVGRKTERALVHQLTIQYPATHTLWGQGIIKSPQFGSPVLALQRDLSALKDYQGGIDGVFNPATVLALKQFQRGHGLRATGQLGKMTALALDKALAAHRAKKPFVLGFYTQYESTATASQTSLSQHLSQISAIAPLWYSFRANGSLHDLGYHYARVRAYAKAHHVGLYPMIINGFENSAVVESPTIRAQVISKLRAMALADGYAGYNIDFEGLNPNTRAGMNAFIKQLAEALNPIGRTISVDVPPKASPNNRYAKPYDFSVLAQYARRIILMTYDYHSVGSPPGPVAPYPWMISRIQYALTRIPASKLVLGLAVYGYDWSSSGKTVEYHDAQMIALAHRRGVPIQWNALDKEFTFQYMEGGISHVAWFEDGYSDKFRMQLAKKFHLGGIAMWRLGDENPQFWAEVQKTGW